MGKNGSGKSTFAKVSIVFAHFLNSYKKVYCVPYQVISLEACSCSFASICNWNGIFHGLF